MTGPTLLVFVFFVIFPIAVAAYYGFFSWQGYGPAKDFVGFRNYVLIFQDGTFHRRAAAQRGDRRAVIGDPRAGRRPARAAAEPEDARARRSSGCWSSSPTSSPRWSSVPAGA